MPDRDNTPDRSSPRRRRSPGIRASGTTTRRRGPLTPALAVALGAAPVAAGCGSSGGKVGVIGDSITDLSREPLHHALDDTYEVELVGKFGARSDEVLNEVRLIAASKPSEAIINIGTNDALQQVPAEQTRGNVAQMVDLLSDASCVYLVEINEGITRVGTPRRAEAQAINAELRSIADEADNVSIIEWNRIIADNGGNSAVTYDSVHLSEKGIVLLADTYRNALDDC